MGRAGEMLIDVTDGDTIKQVQLEEQIDTLMLRINEFENKNKMLTSEKLLMFVENKELKTEIATLNRKNNLLKIANKFLKSREQIIWKIEKERYDSLKVAINDIVDYDNKEKPLEFIKFTGYMLMVIVSFLSVFLASVVYIRFFG